MEEEHPTQGIKRAMEEPAPGPAPPSKKPRTDLAAVPFPKLSDKCIPEKLRRGGHKPPKPWSLKRFFSKAPIPPRECIHIVQMVSGEEVDSALVKKGLARPAHGEEEGDDDKADYVPPPASSDDDGAEDEFERAIARQRGLETASPTPEPGEDSPTAPVTQEKPKKKKAPKLPDDYTLQVAFATKQPEDAHRIAALFEWAAGCSEDNGSNLMPHLTMLFTLLGVEDDPSFVEAVPFVGYVREFARTKVVRIAIGFTGAGKAETRIPGQTTIMPLLHVEEEEEDELYDDDDAADSLEFSGSED